MLTVGKIGSQEPETYSLGLHMDDKNQLLRITAVSHSLHLQEAGIRNESWGLKPRNYAVECRYSNLLLDPQIITLLLPHFQTSYDAKASTKTFNYVTAVNSTISSPQLFTEYKAL